MSGPPMRETCQCPSPRVWRHEIGGFFCERCGFPEAAKAAPVPPGDALTPDFLQHRGPKGVRRHHLTIEDECWCSKSRALIAELEGQIRMQEWQAGLEAENASLRAKVATLTAERDAAVAALTSKGYRRTCDIPACNCGDTWAHGGHADTRLREISDALGEYRQGKTLLGAVEELIEARERGADTPGGADLLSPEEREWFEGFASFSETYAAGSKNIQPTREGIARIIAIVRRLAPRPHDGGRA